MLKDSSFLNYVITDAGSAIYDLKSKKPIYKKTIRKHLVKQILMGYNDDYKYIDVCNQNHIYKYSDIEENNEIVIISKDISYILKNATEITHTSISLKKQDLVPVLYQTLEKKIKSLKFLLMQDSFSEKKWIEISPKGCSKFVAIEKLAKYLQIRKEEIICFGDGLNDMDMLAHCENGVAMKNALDEVKKIAKDVTKLDNNHDGIVEYLKEKLSC